MIAPGRRRRTGCAALVIVAILSQTVIAASAAEHRPAAGNAQCRTIVRNFLQRAPLMRLSDEQIVGLLDARRYREAESKLHSAVRRYPDTWAGYTLGNLYAAGLGVPRNASMAFQWYLWSARRGNQFAQRQVADAYLDGEGTKRNAAAAAYWFRIGIAPRQLDRMYFSLAQTYADGRLAPVDRSKSGYYLGKSLRDLRELAKEPNGEAAYYLGLAYEDGHGVLRDRAKSVGYLCRAASLQYAPAIAAIRHLLGIPE